jgi:branched-chain amino acid transport system permease protein
MSSTSLQRLFILLLPVALGAAAMKAPYFLTLLIIILINGIIAMATCFCMGRAGQITLAQSGFVAIGAYVAVLLNLKFHMPIYVGLPAAILLAGLAGFLLSVPIMKLKGHFLGLVTLAFSLVVVEVATHWTSVTNGASGLYGITLPSIAFLDLDPRYEFLLMLTAFWFAVYVASDNLINSRYGRAMQALKFSELGAQASGINIRRFKTEAFTISSGFMGGAGAFYAYFIQYIGPESFPLEWSITIIAMCILGGLTDLRGALVGSAFIGVLHESLRAYPTLQPLMSSLIIILMIMFLPKGIVPSLLDTFTGWRKRTREHGGSLPSGPA